MARMSWSAFRKTLKRCNPHLALLQPRFESLLPSMVFLHQPMSPDADKRGLVEVLSIPSPSFYRGGFPEHDFAMENGKWARGYRAFFSLLAKKKDYAGNRVVKNPEVLSHIMAPGDYQELKRSIREANYTDGYKNYQKYKSVFRDIPNAGDPIGGQRESSTVYSLPS